VRIRLTRREGRAVKLVVAVSVCVLWRAGVGSESEAWPSLLPRRVQMISNTKTVVLAARARGAGRPRPSAPRVERRTWALRVQRVGMAVCSVLVWGGNACACQVYGRAAERGKEARQRRCKTQRVQAGTIKRTCGLVLSRCLCFGASARDCKSWPRRGLYHLKSCLACPYF